MKLFERFYPSNLVVEPCNGRFNQNFNIFKDIQIGMETLVRI